MISNLLLVLGIIIILIGYVSVSLLYIMNLKKKGIASGSEVARELLDDDSVIHVIENKDLIFSKYHIKRKMLRLSSKDYDSDSLITSAIVSLLSGYAICDSKYLRIIGYVFRKLKFITFSPLVAIIISLFVYNVGDAKIGIFLLCMILFYQYLLVMINGEALQKIINIKKEVRDITQKIVNSYTMFFVSSLVFILRLVVIIMGI